METVTIPKTEYDRLKALENDSFDKQITESIEDIKHGRIIEY
jgi:hypothetical protein